MPKLTSPQFILLLFSLLLHTPTISLSSRQHSCRIRPPYHNHKIISFFVTTATHLDRIQQVLSARCELFVLAGNAIRLHRTSYLLVTNRQFRALTDLQSVDDSFPRVKIVSRYPRRAFATSSKVRARYARPKRFSPTQMNVRADVDTSFYNSYSELHVLEGKWKSLEQQYGPLVRMESIGKSVEQRDIYALTIGKTNSQRPRRILITAMQHAREWISTHVATYIAESLAVIFANGLDDSARFLNNTEIIILPLVNPDGYLFTHIPDENGLNRMQRKNRHEAGCDDTQRDGVDLNRNWGTAWGVGHSASEDPCDDNYIGIEPFSEPEVKAVRSLVERTDGIESHIDFHSYGCLVLGPWSYTLDKSPRWEEYCNLGHDIARSMSTSGSCKYVYKRAAQSYLVKGSMGDWMAKRNVLSFVVELRPANAGPVFSNRTAFELPEDQIKPACMEGLSAVEHLLLYKNNSSSHPKCLAEEPVPDERVVDSSNNLEFVIGVSLGALLFVVLVTSSLIVMRRRRLRRRLAQQEMRKCRDAEELSTDWTLFSASPMNQLDKIQDVSSSTTPNS